MRYLYHVRKATPGVASGTSFVPRIFGHFGELCESMNVAHLTGSPKASTSGWSKHSSSPIASARGVSRLLAADTK